MNLEEAKAYLGEKWVGHKNYQAQPQHNLYEPVDVRRTMIRHALANQQTAVAELNITNLLRRKAK
jgi:hypothetical protein